MIVRQLDGEDDVKDAVRICGLGWREAYDGLLPHEVLQKQPIDPSQEHVQELNERLGEDRDGVLVAVDGGEVLGFAVFRRGEKETDDFVDIGQTQLEAIYVDPSYWRQGVGTKLLKRGIERLPETVDTLYLETLLGNEIGQTFYESRGFEQFGEGTYEIADVCYPTVLYKLELE